MASLIYSSPLLLGLLLRIKYGRYYDFRLRRVALEIPEGARVVDLCCGDCAVYLQYLHKKGVDYLGIDINWRIARLIKEKGARVMVADVRTCDIPPCDVLLCLGSLYRFSNEYNHMFQSAQQVANKIVLLGLVENLASSKNALIASVAAWMTDSGEGPVSFHFQEDALVKMWGRCGFSTVEMVGAELLGIWNRQ